jgi:hypothetical protein
MNERLHFRRQFLLSRVRVESLCEWTYLQIGQFHLHCHPDLETNKISDANRTIVLLGYLFSASNPEKTNKCILEDIFSLSNSFQSFLETLKQYAGQFAFIYEQAGILNLVHDALAVREVYYHTGNNCVVCGSQPTLLVAYSDPVIKPTNNPEIVRFYNRQMKTVRNGRLWVGDGTYFEGVRHLLPNHYLDLKTQSAVRYWPSAKLTRLSLDDVVTKASVFLQGMLEAVTHRQKVMMAVTAGTDSRTLLAASRKVSDKIYYFINNRGQLNEKSADLYIPKNMFERIQIPFHIHNIQKGVDSEFKEIYFKNSFFASEKLMPTIYNIYYKQHSNKINILGVGEIGRALWGDEPAELNGYYLAYRLHYRSSKYATDQCNRWLEEIRPVAKANGINIITLLLWEQLLGNWGAVGNTESDIAIDEFDPFNSHFLYELLLGVHESIARNPQVIFNEMIRRMWPELMEYPINPPSKIKDKIAEYLKIIGVYPILSKVKYYANYYYYITLNT